MSPKQRKRTGPRQTRSEERESALCAVRQRAELQNLEFFRDDRRRAFATVPLNDHCETFEIRSRDGRLWVQQALFDVIGRAPKAWVTQCLEEFETFAICRGPMHQVHVRVAEQNGAIYIDLANPQWQVVEITASGWRVLDYSPVKFKRPAGMGVLPCPKDGGQIRDVLGFLNIRPQSEILLLAWLTYALRDVRSYPIIVLSGVQGSGKSTTTRVLRDLIDPSVAALTTTPRSERDLAIAATNGHLVCMDNLSELPAQLSDALCRLSTGGAFRTRELYTNDSEILFTFCCPSVVNGIEEELAIRPDLLDRAILIHCEAISEDRRKDEETFWRDFDRVRPQLLGRVLDMISIGLGRLPGVKLSSTPRMADFTKWGVAIEQAMGFERGSFLAAYTTSIADANVASLDASPCAIGIYRLLGEQRYFRGSTLQLLNTLRSFLEGGSVKYPELAQLLRHPRFPKSSSQLAGEISRVEPNLKKLGISVQRGRTHIGRWIRIERVAGEEGPKPNDSRVGRDDSNVAGKVM